MADFLKSYSLLLGHEGNYSNDPVDSGGETWKGISRKNNSDWAGWVIVDQVKKNYPRTFEANLKSDGTLEAAVQQLYKSKYWDVANLDRLNNQCVADEVFEAGVNIGPKVYRWLQECMNALNIDGRTRVLYPSVIVDGQIGSTTIKVFNSISLDRQRLILKLLNCEQGCYYKALALERTSQKKFLGGWLNRVSL